MKGVQFVLIEGIRKWYLFREKWYIKGYGVGPRGGASPYKNLLCTPLHMYLRSQIKHSMARKRKSWTSLNYTFKLNTIYLASILFTWWKFTCVYMHVKITRQRVHNRFGGMRDMAIFFFVVIHGMWAKKGAGSGNFDNERGAGFPIFIGLSCGERKGKVAG